LSSGQKSDPSPGTLAAASKPAGEALVVTAVDQKGQLFREHVGASKLKANLWSFRTRRLISLDSHLLLEMLVEGKPPVRLQARVASAQLSADDPEAYDITAQTEGQMGGAAKTEAAAPSQKPGAYPAKAAASEPAPAAAPAPPAPVMAAVPPKPAPTEVDREAAARALHEEAQKIARKLESNLRAAAEKAVADAAVAEAKRRLRGELEQDTMLLTEAALGNLRARISAELNQGLQELQAAASGASAAAGVEELQRAQKEMETRLQAARLEVQELTDQLAAGRAQMQALLEQLQQTLRQAQQTLERLRGAEPAGASSAEKSSAPEKPAQMQSPAVPGEKLAAELEKLFQQAQERLMQDVQRTFEAPAPPAAGSPAGSSSPNRGSTSSGGPGPRGGESKGSPHRW
jgi:HPt (histidine-containing phosphotransfer) domain-containing protein